MTRVTAMVITDDLDGTPAQQTVRFAIDGVAYEIDLTDEHAGQMRAALAPFVDAARTVHAERRAATVGRRRSASDYDPQAVRAWANSHGVQIPRRGRIPRAIVDQFHAAGY